VIAAHRLGQTKNARALLTEVNKEIDRGLPVMHAHDLLVVRVLKLEADALFKGK
jgi:hypothetical protein